MCVSSPSPIHLLWSLWWGYSSPPSMSAHSPLKEAHHQGRPQAAVHASSGLRAHSEKSWEVTKQEIRLKAFKEIKALQNPSQIIPEMEYIQFPACFPNTTKSHNLPPHLNCISASLLACSLSPSLSASCPFTSASSCPWVTLASSNSDLTANRQKNKATSVQLCYYVHGKFHWWSNITVGWCRQERKIIQREQKIFVFCLASERNIVTWYNTIALC